MKIKDLLTIFLIIILSLGIIACPDTDSGDGEPDDPPIIDPPDDPPPIDPPEEPSAGPVLFTLYDGEKLMYYDGTDVSIAYYNDNINFANSRTHSIGNVLYHFDAYGQPILTEWLPVEPDGIITIPENKYKAVVYQDETWTIEDIDPVEAVSLGAQPKHYTRIFNGVEEVGNWYNNDWEFKKVISPKYGGVIAIDTNKNYHNLDGSEIIFFASNAKLMIHTFNLNSKTAMIKTDLGNWNVSWTYNFFNSAKFEKSDDIWYSQNGYVFDEDTGILQEEASAMWDWNVYPYPIATIYGEHPTLASCEERIENNVEILYYIECNTGTLIKFNPFLDTVSEVLQVYPGDGLRQTGVNIAEQIEPEIVEDELYFHYGGSIYVYDFITGIVSIFGEDMELNVW